ncbi:MAG: hypothetical protein QOF37_2740, partial [Thermoleophilaceae bacterium]|nr:hypothetical protein [Thermoleophilaceae bacterium]
LAGSIFGLRPGTRYDVELKLPDRTVALQAATRALPRTSPAHPRRRPVRTAAALSAALASARPGDVIELAPGIYRGSFSLQASGTTDDPIVVRGRSARRSIIDGQGCTGCNILETYGSHVHVERLTLRHGMRGFKNQGGGTTDLAVRHVRILDTTLGIGVRTRSFDSYICDNLLRGRLRWPKTYATDGGAHSSDEGIVVWGEGHVVCHNDVAGYGDALNVGEGDRADDFFGNEVRWSYDNAVELDFAQGNVRLWQNRFENTYSPISTQPVDGGPAYVVRNVVVNMVDEPLKFHANGVGAGADEPSGMLVWNNTFVSPVAALLMQTPAAAHWFDVRNNIFMGPPPKVSRFWPSTVEWSGRIDHGVFDHDGYWPDGRFKFGDIRAPDLAVLRRPGLEQHGVVLSSGTFAHIRPLRTSRRLLAPLDAALSATSPARRRGVPIPGITAGTAPDLGALQRGSPRPRYGVRP